MYIEMIDETGQVSAQMQEQITELLQFAAEKLASRIRKWL